MRERKEDIPELIQYFLNNFPEKSLSQQVKRKLIEYNYPGNIRELENIITRTALLSDSVIEDVYLPVEGQETENQTVSYSDIPDEGINLDNLEQILIRKAIEKSGGNKSTAAQLLGITRRRLYSMMQRFGIEE